jgi:hypothetical protein
MKGVFAMKNRKFGRISALSLALLGLAIFTRPGQTQENRVVRTERSAMMQLCAAACSDCQRACDACATHCARMLEEGKKEHSTTLTTCQDCATTCSAAAQIVARSGPFSNAICMACAEACATCGKECEKFPNDKRMKACASECTKCEQACRDMLKEVDSGK